MYAQERQKQILLQVKAAGRASVNELAEGLGVSKATIRTDLTALEANGLIKRTHGGAIPAEEALAPAADTRSQEETLAERSNHAQKEAIAQTALDLVDDGDIILIDSGTTALAFAHELATSSLVGLVVYSNDFSVLYVLEGNTAISVNALPGKIRSGFHYAYGDSTIAALQGAHFDKLFLTTSAIDFENGLTVVKPHLSNLKKTMIQASKQVILLADSSKFGQTRFQKFADLSEVDVIVTDAGISGADQAATRATVGNLILCP